MAIYYATTKPISRSSGRSATASAAYRAGVAITDERTGLKHDYSKRGGVEMAYAFDKTMKTVDREELWNKAELAENRKDGRTAREWVLAIPHELVPEDKKKRKDIKKNEGARVALRFAKTLAERYNVGVDVAIHSPDKEGDNRNWHAHIMTTTREISRTAAGIELGDKTSIELSNAKRKELGLGTTSTEIKGLRKEWETIVNTQLEKQGIEERIDHRSFKERGIKRQPTIKMGWQASAMERRGVVTDKGNLNRQIKADNEQLKDLQLEIVVLKDQQKQQAQKRTQKPVERQKDLEATSIASTPKPKPIEPQAMTQEDSNAIALRVDVAMENIEEVAGEIQKQDLSRLVKIGKPLLNKYDELKANKPILLGRKQWEKDVNQALKDYNQVKSQYDQIKADGITDALREKAIGIIYKDNPDDFFKLKAEAKQASEYEKKNEVRERLKRTSEIAKDGRQYTGKIVTISEHGIIQQTPTGKRIYHDPEKINLGSHVKGDTVKVIYENDKGHVQQAEREHSKQRDYGMER